MSRWHERDFDAEDEAADPRGRRDGGFLTGLARLGFVFGAVAVVGGLVWLGFRHSAGVTDEASLPLIKADPRPLRARPAQPGGMEVPNQGILVFDRLDPGSAPPMVERLLPPPEAPLPRPVAPVVPPPPADAAAKGASRVAIETVMAPPPMAAKPGEDSAPPAAAPLAPAAAAPPAAQAPAPAPAAKAAAVPAPATAAKPPAAKLAPGTQAPAQAHPAPAPKAAATATAAVAKPAPLALTGGSYRVQVGAVPKEADAQSEWRRLQSRHRDLLGSLSLSVVRADLGDKGVYYRLQAGPLDEARARAICDQLKSQNVGCQLARN
ncbi:MAG: SPOR domain-containing protein [Rhodospirillaceae bacterium]